MISYSSCHCIRPEKEDSILLGIVPSKKESSFSLKKILKETKQLIRRKGWGQEWNKAIQRDRWLSWYSVDFLFLCMTVEKCIESQMTYHDFMWG